MKLLSMLIHQIEKAILSKEKLARKSGVDIGNENFIASCFWSSEAYLIKIGNHCQITEGVKIFTHGGGNAVRFQYPKFDCFGKVEIGDYVYLGTNVLIMPGVRIGNNVLVAAGSVVTKSIPDNCVVGGNPAKFICTIDTFIERNLPFNLNSKGMKHKDKKRLLCESNDLRFISKGYMSIPN